MKKYTPKLDLKEKAKEMDKNLKKNNKKISDKMKKMEKEIMGGSSKARAKVTLN